MRSSIQTLTLAPPHRGDHLPLAQRPAGAGAMAPLHPAASERRLSRLLVNVTVDRSIWPVHLVLGADSTVADLVRAAVATYVREGRRPPLPAASGDAVAGFELHFSKFSLESLRPEDKVVDLGSRNFFLCARRSTAA